MSEDKDKPVHDNQRDEGLSKVTNFFKKRLGKTDAPTMFYDAVEEFAEDDKGK
jgi:hypothetical protein